MKELVGKLMEADAELEACRAQYNHTTLQLKVLGTSHTYVARATTHLPSVLSRYSEGGDAGDAHTQEQADYVASHPQADHTLQTHDDHTLQVRGAAASHPLDGDAC